MNMHLSFALMMNMNMLGLDELFLMSRYNHMFILILPCLCFCHDLFAALDEIICYV